MSAQLPLSRTSRASPSRELQSQLRSLRKQHRAAVSRAAYDRAANIALRIETLLEEDAQRIEETEKRRQIAERSRLEEAVQLRESRVIESYEREKERVRAECQRRLAALEEELSVELERWEKRQEDLMSKQRCKFSPTFLHMRQQEELLGRTHRYHQAKGVRARRIVLQQEELGEFERAKRESYEKRRAAFLEKQERQRRVLQSKLKQTFFAFQRKYTKNIEILEQRNLNQMLDLEHALTMEWNSPKQPEAVIARAARTHSRAASTIKGSLLLDREKTIQERSRLDAGGDSGTTSPVRRSAR